MALHYDEVDSSALAGHNIRKAGDIPLLSSVQVAAATSLDDIRNDIDATVCHADEEGLKKVCKDGIDLAENLGDISDTTILSDTTVESIVDHTQAADDDRRGPEVLE